VERISFRNRFVRDTKKEQKLRISNTKRDNKYWCAETKKLETFIQGNIYKSKNGNQIMGVKKWDYKIY
jgi:hypothetical protein